MVEFAKDGKTVLALSSLGRETAALVRLDVNTGEETEVIAYNAKCDTGGILLDDDTKEVRAVSFNYGTSRLFEPVTLALLHCSRQANVLRSLPRARSTDRASVLRQGAGG